MLPSTNENRLEKLYLKISVIIDKARQTVKTTVNTAMVYSYFEIGRYIVEEEQNGKSRAEYGKAVLKQLSERLTANYGEGWTYSNLRQIRQFYYVYSNSNLTNSVCQIQFTLSWSHYLILMRIANPEERSFYEIECKEQDWSVRQLSRQVNSSLYERLALSRDKKEVLRLASEGQKIEKKTDILKNPLTLEFLGLKPDSAYSETKLENAIISRLQDFLLEMGKGFLFEARQKRFTFNEKHFFVDLVLYNRLLQCYVLIDLKIDELSHQDLGQMQMYVNYFDRFVKRDFEKPTIGILLCKQKDDALVELTLPTDSNIYAQEYQLYLPGKQILQAKLKDWIEELDE